jgi:hypothetical protein
VVIKKYSAAQSQLFSEAERVQLKKSSFERVVVKNLVVLEMAVDGD